jgi:hypothetical protein
MVGGIVLPGAHIVLLCRYLDAEGLIDLLLLSKAVAHIFPEGTTVGDLQLRLDGRKNPLPRSVKLDTFGFEEDAKLIMEEVGTEDGATPRTTGLPPFP